MTVARFPDAGTDEHAPGMRDFLARDDAALFVAERADGRLAGYLEVGARLDDVASHRAHARLGYAEVDRVVQFRKALDASPGMA